MMGQKLVGEANSCPSPLNHLGRREILHHLEHADKVCRQGRRPLPISDRSVTRSVTFSDPSSRHPAGLVQKL